MFLGSSCAQHARSGRGGHVRTGMHEWEGGREEWAGRGGRKRVGSESQGFRRREGHCEARPTSHRTEPLLNHPPCVLTPRDDAMSVPVLAHKAVLAPLQPRVRACRAASPLSDHRTCGPQGPARSTGPRHRLTRPLLHGNPQPRLSEGTRRGLAQGHGDRAEAWPHGRVGVERWELVLSDRGWC